MTFTFLDDLGMTENCNSDCIPESLTTWIHRHTHFIIQWISKYVRMIHCHFTRFHFPFVHYLQVQCIFFAMANAFGSIIENYICTQQFNCSFSHHTHSVIGLYRSFWKHFTIRYVNTNCTMLHIWIKSSVSEVWSMREVLVLHKRQCNYDKIEIFFRDNIVSYWI